MSRIKTLITTDRAGNRYIQFTKQIKDRTFSSSKTALDYSIPIFALEESIDTLLGSLQLAEENNNV